MPRRYTRKARKSSRRGRKISYSRYSTYRHRSSKAQARQIYGLSKKINSVYRKLKPETQILSINPDSSVEVKYTSAGDTPIKSTIMELTSLTGGVNYVKIINIKLYLMAAFTNPDDSQVGEGDLATENVYFRLVVFRCRGDASSAPSVDQIINSWARQNAPSTDVLSEKAKWFGPLRSGVTTQYKILLDRKFVLTQNYIQHNKQYNFRCNYKYERANVSSQNQHKGAIYALVWAYNPKVSNPNNYCSCKLYAKQAFINANLNTVAGPVSQN